MESQLREARLAHGAIPDVLKEQIILEHTALDIGDQCPDIGDK